MVGVVSTYATPLFPSNFMESKNIFSALAPLLIIPVPTKSRASSHKGCSSNYTLITW